ncbi:MAG: glycosyltransferase family 39 protein [Elusimicrobia bacterium]|nr:glycosyltransferase family 39 protein [Candidatus Liberimonas magnetica]
MTGLKKYLYPFLLLIVFGVTILAVSPKGNFPLNDDWVYSYSVRHLFDKGIIKLSDWVAPSIVFHVYWGWLWCKIFGKFDFQILRLSTIVLSCIGILFFYFILDKISNNKKLSFLGALTLLFNPLWFILSLTFMTDVTYLAISFISIYFYYSSISENKEEFFIIGSMFAAFAYLIRQLGILLPFSVILYLFLIKSINLKKLIKISLIPIITAIAHRYWLQNIHGLTWAYKTGQDLMLGFDQFIPRILGSTVYLGLFVLPFSIAIILSNKNNSSNNKMGIGKQSVLLLSALFMLLFVLSHGAFPYFENAINKYGLGTVTAHNMSYKSQGIFAYDWFWNILTFAGIVSFLSFLYNVMKNIRSTQKSTFFICIFLVQFIVSALRYKFFDRYTMLLMPFGIIPYIELYKNSKINITACSCILGLICIYTVVGSKDYFSWNRAKWQAGEMLVKQGFAYNEIANGFDWDGWYTFEKNMNVLKTQKAEKNITEWEWQKLNPYRVLVSFKPPDDPGKLALKVNYKTPLKNGDNYIYAWKIY